MFRKVLNIVRHRSAQHYLVLSAPGKRAAGDDKITDLLCRARDAVETGESPAHFLEIVRRRFAAIIRDLSLSVNPDSLIDTLERDVLTSRDQIVTRGETICAQIFAKFAGIPFVDASKLIHFDSDGRVLKDKTQASVQKMANHLPSAVIPGFYGSLPSGKIKAFARGGSDITGALIAAALNAGIYENWTDVDGLMSIDPAICPDAVLHPLVSYRQMQALSNAGARVLHPCCLSPVREAGIRTLLKNTFNPDAPGTCISDHIYSDVPCICIKEYADMLPQSESPHGKSGALISIFGLDEPHFAAAAEIAKPTAMLCREGCLRLITAALPDQNMLKRLHALLLSGFSPS